MTDKLSQIPSSISRQELAYLRFRESEHLGLDRRVLVVEFDVLTTKIAGFENDKQVFDYDIELFDILERDIDKIKEKAASLDFNPEFVIAWGLNPEINTKYRELKALYPEATVLHDHNPEKTIDSGCETYLRLAEEYQQYLVEIRAKIESTLSSEQIRVIVQEEFDAAINDTFAPTFRHVYDKFIRGKITNNSGDASTNALSDCLTNTAQRLLSDIYPEHRQQITPKVCAGVTASVERSIASALVPLGETIPENIMPLVEFDLPTSGISNPWNKFPVRQLTTDIFGSQLIAGNIFKARTHDERVIFTDAVRIKARQLHYSWPLEDMVAAVSATRKALKEALDTIFNGRQFRVSADDLTPKPLCNYDTK